MNILESIKDTMTITGLTLAVFFGLLVVIQIIEAIVTIMYALIN